MTDETTDGVVVRLPGEGETTSHFGDAYTDKVAGEETGGALAMIEADLATHSSVRPLHVNTWEDENYYVVEGTLTFRLGERTIEAPAGSFVLIPVTWYTITGKLAPRRSSNWGFPLRPVSRSIFATVMAKILHGVPDTSKRTAFYEKYGLRMVGSP